MRFVLVFLIALLVAPVSASASNLSDGKEVCDNKIELSSEDPSVWQPQEVWAWNEVLCLGKHLNMKEFDEADTARCDASKHSGNKYLIISSSFIDFAVKNLHISNFDGRKELSISCAIVVGDVYISGKSIDSIGFYHSSFDGAVNLSNLIVGGVTTFYNSDFLDGFYLDDFELSGGLRLLDSSFEGDVKLRNGFVSSGILLESSNFGSEFYLNHVEVDGGMSLSSSDFHDDLTLYDLNLNGDLTSLLSARFTNVYLNSSFVDADLDLSDSDFRGEVIAFGTTVNGASRINDAVFFGEVNFSRSTFNRGLSMSSSDFRRDLKLFRVKTNEDGDVNLDYSFFEQGIDLRWGDVGGLFSLVGGEVHGDFHGYELKTTRSVKLDAATFGSSVNLNNSKLGGQLSLTNVDVHKEFSATHIEASQGIFSVGAVYRNLLSLNSANLMGNQLNLKDAHVQGDLNLTASQGLSLLFFNGLNVSGRAYLDSLRVDGDALGRGAQFSYLSLESSVFGGPVNLIGAKFDSIYGTGLDISGGLFLKNISVDQELGLNSVNVKGAVLLNRAHVGNGIDLTNADIESNLELSDAKVYGTTVLSGMDLSGSLRMNDGGVYQDVLMSNTVIGESIYAVKSIFEGELKASGVEVKGAINFSESGFEGVVLLDGASSQSGSLILRDAKVEEDLFLSASDFGGSVNFTGAEVYGEVVGRAMTVSKRMIVHDLFAGRHWDLAGAQFGDVSFLRSVFSAKLGMESVEINGDLVFEDSEFFGELELSNGSIAGSGKMSASKFSNDAKFDNFDVLRDFIIRDGSSFGNLTFRRAHIVKSFEIADVVGSGHLSFSDANIDQVFRFGTDSQFPKWTPEAFVSLNNLKVGALSDHSNAWDGLDNNMDLSGFKYSSVSAGLDSFLLRETDWYLSWVGKQRDFDKLPYFDVYNEISKVLDKNGYSQKAADILTKGKFHRISVSNSGFLTKIFQYVVGYLTQFGQTIVLLIYSFLALVLLGAVIGAKFDVLRAGVGRGVGFNGLRENINDASHLSFIDYVVYSIKSIYIFNGYGDYSHLRSVSKFLPYYFMVHSLIGLCLLFLMASNVSSMFK